MCVFKPVEKCIKDEKEDEDVVQLSTDHSGKDGEESVLPLQNVPRYNSNVVEGSARSTDEECPSRMLLAPGQVSELTDDSAQQNKRSIPVNKHHVVEATSSQGSPRTDDWEILPYKIPRKYRSRVNYPKKHKCTVCGAKFCSPCELRYHTRIHTGEKPFSCSFCDMKFRLRNMLNVHELRHKNELPQCDLCGVRLSDFRSLRQHILSHSDANYKHCCSVCQKRFHLKSDLNKHMLTHSDERPYTCQDCGGRFRCHSDLRRHMAVHTQEKNHVCLVCGKKFLQRDNMKGHMRVHTGQKPYHCETCGKTFSTTNILTYHQITHTNEKPFICTTCNKTFTQPSALTRHKLIHSGVQPYECSVCGMRFNQSSSMQRHMLTHTGEKPYSCSDCGQRFTQSGGLASHRRRRCPAKQHRDVTEGDADNGQLV